MGNDYDRTIENTKIVDAMLEKRVRQLARRGVIARFNAEDRSEVMDAFNTSTASGRDGRDGRVDATMAVVQRLEARWL